MSDTSTELLTDILSLVLEQPPLLDELERLSIEERQEIIDWAGYVHAEAGDNNVSAGEAPACLLKLLPANHFYQGWREGQKNNPYGLCEWGGEDDQCSEDAVCLREVSGYEMSVCRMHLEAPDDSQASAEQ
jgi:hypothetical protein